MVCPRLLKTKKIFQEKKNIEALWFEDGYSIFFFTGFFPSSGILLIPKLHTPILFVDGRYIEEAKKESVIDVKPLDTLSKVLEKEKIKNLGVDAMNITLHRKEHIEKKFHLKIHPIPALSYSFRLIKDEEELKKMQKAADITEAGFLHIQKYFEEKVSEQKLAWEFEKFCREKMQAEELAFPSIIAFGVNTACPHHIPKKNRFWQKGEAILCDLGVKMENYCSDFTRMWFPKKGHKLQKWYEVVSEAKMAAIEKCKPGVTILEVDEEAEKIISKAGFDRTYILHGLGHGVGLEVHEPPRVRKDGPDKNFVLEENMVITIEPGLYKKEFGGVRNEDMIVITKTGCRNFYTL